MPSIRTEPYAIPAVGAGTPDVTAEKKPTNVSRVRQLSPLRYPGGKTWLVPQISAWLAGLGNKPILIEPFAGGAIASLTAVMEAFARRAVMVEKDEDLSCFWRAVLEEPDALTSRILNFNMTRDNVTDLLGGEAGLSTVERAFRVFVRNRTQRGGILAGGASLMRNGENGKGIASRWYPDTLAARILEIGKHARRFNFIEGDGLAEIARWKDTPDAAFFVDPPYTANDGKRAGQRLYQHNSIDHERLFDLMAQVRGSFMMTYDENRDVRAMARMRNFRIKEVAMKNTHHAVMKELLIFPR